jgi:voltage-gated potassium channel Kch
VRLIVFFPVFYFAGLDRNNAIDASTKLAQISEFCLVIAYLGVKTGHIDGADVSVVIFAFVITAVATPFLFNAATMLPLTLGPLLGKIGFKAPDERISTEDAGHGAAKILILGYHRVAAALLQDIARQRPDLLREIAVLDINVQTHGSLRKQGVRVIYGSAGNPEALRHAGVEHAELIISTIADELLRGTSNEAITRAIRTLTKDAVVFACATRPINADELYAAGASYVFMPSAETANGIFEAGTAALTGKLDDFRRTRESACGPLQTRLDVDKMSI